jgi:hypothetical protein
MMHRVFHFCMTHVLHCMLYDSVECGGAVFRDTIHLKCTCLGCCVVDFTLVTAMHSLVNAVFYRILSHQRFAAVRVPRAMTGTGLVRQSPVRLRAMTICTAPIFHHVRGTKTLRR